MEERGDVDVNGDDVSQPGTNAGAAEARAARAGLAPTGQGSAAEAEEPSAAQAIEREWRRWKGTLQDIFAVADAALLLGERAGRDFVQARGNTDLHGDYAGSLYRHADYAVGIPDGEVRSEELSVVRSAAHREDLARIRSIRFYMAWGEVLRIEAFFDKGYGVRIRTEGNNTFAVAGASRELSQRIDRGSRAVERPFLTWLLFFSANWGATVGLALAILIGGTRGKQIGLGIVVVALAVLAVALFRSEILPRLVPPLELLPVDKAQTIAARWRSRALKALALLGAALVGAVINELTGSIF